MSQFEYIMVMVALILALALAQALRGLSELATSRSRHWPHTLWLLTMVLLMVQGWWADWDYNAVKEWQFTTYLLAISSYAMLFAGIHLLVPATRTASFDWREQYWAVQKWFFGILFVYFVVAIYVGVVHYGTSLMHPYRAFQSLWLLIPVISAFSKSEKLHTFLTILFLTTLIVSQVLIRMKIGALMVT